MKYLHCCRRGAENIFDPLTLRRVDRAGLVFQDDVVLRSIDEAQVEGLCRHNALRHSTWTMNNQQFLKSAVDTAGRDHCRRGCIIHLREHAQHRGRGGGIATGGDQGGEGGGAHRSQGRTQGRKLVDPVPGGCRAHRRIVRISGAVLRYSERVAVPVVRYRYGVWILLDLHVDRLVVECTGTRYLCHFCPATGMHASY